MSTSSNRKPAQAAPPPNEPFKQAVATALRAMAQTREMEVTYAADKPALVGHGEGAKARLPEPPRKMGAAEAAIVRGHADSMALKLALHSEGCTARSRLPTRRPAPCSMRSNRPASRPSERGA